LGPPRAAFVRNLNTIVLLYTSTGDSFTSHAAVLFRANSDNLRAYYDCTLAFWSDHSLGTTSCILFHFLALGLINRRGYICIPAIMGKCMLCHCSGPCSSSVQCGLGYCWEQTTKQSLWVVLLSTAISRCQLDCRGRFSGTTLLVCCVTAYVPVSLLH